jgi:membrane-associated phospholipid phosphatase
MFKWKKRNLSVIIVFIIYSGIPSFGGDKDIEFNLKEHINQDTKEKNQLLISFSPVIFASAYSYHIIKTNIDTTNSIKESANFYSYKYRVSDKVTPAKEGTLNYQFNDFMSDLGSGTYLYPVVAYMVYHYGFRMVSDDIHPIFVKNYHHRSALILIETIIIGNIIVQGMKVGIGRRRPYVDPDKRLYKSGELENSEFHSFPSGHTFTAFSLASVLSVRYGYSYIWIPIAIAIGYSRVALEKHYFTDVFFSAVYTMNLVELLYGSPRRRTFFPEFRVNIVSAEKLERIKKGKNVYPDEIVYYLTFVQWQS